MSAAYFYQIINLIIGILTVPLLLRFLDPGQFVLWAIFTTFGGLTLQIESSIQIVSVRRIAREFHAKKLSALQAAIINTRRAYRILAGMTVLPVAAIGATYLFYVATPRFTAPWPGEWAVFILTYGANYYFGANNAVLLAAGRVATYSYITSFTRVMNFAATSWSLSEGFGVMGVCASFALSVGTNCCLIAWAARKALSASALPPTLNAVEARSSAISSDIVRYTCFTVAGFALYKGGVLTAAWFFSKEAVGAYSLTLQTYTMLSSFALVPIQAWLPKLVQAILADRKLDIVRELGRTIALANGAFLVGILLLVGLGNDLLLLVGAKITFPSPGDLILVAVAFGIELNLLVLINLLVTRQHFSFIKIYVSCVFIGFLAAAAALLAGQSLVISLIIVPALVQGLVCFPVVLLLVCKELEMTLPEFSKVLTQSLLGRSS